MTYLANDKNSNTRIQKISKSLLNFYLFKRNWVPSNWKFYRDSASPKSKNIMVVMPLYLVIEWEWKHWSSLSSPIPQMNI